MLPPEIAKQIHLLEIRTNRVVDEITGGAYRSVFKGRGIEFDEVREYTPEDDVRDIDWNVSARMGLPYIKKYIEERELTVLLLVDVSASGAFGSAEKTKRRTAAELAALLAFSAGRNGDKVGLMMFSDRIELYVPPKSGRRHTLRLIREMLAFEPASPGTDIALALRETAQMLKKKSVKTNKEEEDALEMGNFDIPEFYVTENDVSFATTIKNKLNAKRKGSIVRFDFERPRSWSFLLAWILSPKRVIT